MREILFRGKRECDGQWIKGALAQYDKNKKVAIYIITDAEAEELFGTIVDPTTVGQYTGLNDMTGKKIFEGDIVRWESEGEKHDLVVAFRNGCFVCLHPELDIEPEPETLYECLGLGLTVVGNVYDEE